MEYESKLIEALEGCHLRTGELMREHTTFHIGGPADYFVSPESADDIKNILSVAEKFELPFFILGNGSNLLVSDKGIRGIVISLREHFNKVSISGEKVKCQSGVSNQALSKLLIQNALSGFEFASGIPGSIGGGAAMNAGAYGGELKNIIETVNLIDSAGREYTLSADEMRYEHRSSIALEKNLVITEVALSLKKGNKAEIESAVRDYNMRRADKQPLDKYSAGSAFKRPRAGYASRLIDQAGLKGLSVGAASVSLKHAGFIVNDGTASCRDVKELIAKIKAKIYAKYAVKLEEEVRIVGEF